MRANTGGAPERVLAEQPPDRKDVIVEHVAVGRHGVLHAHHKLNVGGPSAPSIFKTNDKSTWQLGLSYSAGIQAADGGILHPEMLSLNNELSEFL